MRLKTGYAGNCYSCTQAELLVALRETDKPLKYWDAGPYMHDALGRELHPRRDTVRRLIASGVLVESEDANRVQRDCGLRTYRLAARAA